MGENLENPTLDCVCTVVGGKHDGQRVHVCGIGPKDRWYIRIESISQERWRQPLTRVYRTEEYRLTPFRSGNTLLYVLCPPDWRDEEVMEHLIRNYRGARP